MATLSIRNPVALAQQLSAFPMVPRLNTLNDRRIALYWNGKPGGDRALVHISNVLKSQFPASEFELIRSIKPAPRKTLEYLKTFNAVIGSTADDGSSTQWLAQDLAEVERGSVPTVALIAETSEREFKAFAKGGGVPGLPYVAVVETGLTTLQDAEIQRLVEAVSDTVVRNLTASQPSVERQDSAGRVSLAATLFGLDTPEIETFEGEDQLGAWQAMNAAFLERGWGDGFPIVPPTPEAVARMLSGSRRAPEEEVAVLLPCYGIATVEKIAINAVMAGCQPAHLPVLIAAVECMAEPEFGLHHDAVSTGNYSTLVVVNGPITRRIGMNSGSCYLGPGAPSAVNTAIGRAVRLMLMNIGGNYVGVTDMDTHGDPKKYSMCMAENEAANPWEPLHVERGFDRQDSTVTVFVAETSISHADASKEPRQFLESLAQAVCAPGVVASCRWMSANNLLNATETMQLKPQDYHDECLVILSPDHASMLAGRGWSKGGIKEVIHHFATLRVRERPGVTGKDIAQYAVGETTRVRPEWAWLHDFPDEEVPMYRSPDCFQILVAGGPAGKSLVVLGGRTAFTRRIEE